jgi:hypothetical protein
MLKKKLVTEKYHKKNLLLLITDSCAEVRVSPFTRATSTATRQPTDVLLLAEVQVSPSTRATIDQSKFNSQTSTRQLIDLVVYFLT